MKVVLTFKCPDVVDDAISNSGLEYENAEAEIRRACNLYVEYGEYVRIEIDTVKQTAEVLRV